MTRKGRAEIRVERNGSGRASGWMGLQRQWIAMGSMAAAEQWTGPHRRGRCLDGVDLRSGGWAQPGTARRCKGKARVGGAWQWKCRAMRRTATDLHSEDWKWMGMDGEDRGAGD